jgi:hypothetical protein
LQLKGIKYFVHILGQLSREFNEPYYLNTGNGVKFIEDHPLHHILEFKVASYSSKGPNAKIVREIQVALPINKEINLEDSMQVIQD